VDCLGSSSQTLGGGKGFFFTDTLCYIDFEFLVFSKLVIGCVSGDASAFLNLVCGFSVDLALCWSRCVNCQSPGRGNGHRTSGC